MIEKIKNLRSTEKGRALFKLMLYGIFLSLVFIILFLGNAINKTKHRPIIKKEESSEHQESNESVKEKTYSEKQAILLNGDYSFIYSIKGSVEANFEGEVKEKRVNGFKETPTSLIRYSIEDGITYKLGLKSKEEYPSLYEGLDESLFDFPSLFETLNQTSATIEKDEYSKKYFYKEVLEYNIEVITNTNFITELLIKNDQIEYNFKFSY